MRNKVGLLFDGDILLYRAGFAAEKRVYIPAPGSYLALKYPHVMWSSAKDAKADLDKWSLDYWSNITWKREPEPLENAIHNLNSIINTVTNDIKTGAAGLPIGPGEIVVQSYIFITGCGTSPNFREALDPAYKANRDPKNKPVHLDALKEHLLKNYATVVTQGCEADDYLAQAQTDMTRLYPDMTPVIVTLDKDLYQIPGYKYNFVDKVVEDVSVEEGEKFFFRQMVLGDKADNIEGIKGYGEVKTEKLFAKCVSVNDYRLKAEQAYARAFHPKDNAQREWNKNCDLLWIWRKVPDECPYKVPAKVSI